MLDQIMNKLIMSVEHFNKLSGREIELGGTQYKFSSNFSVNKLATLKFIPKEEGYGVDSLGELNNLAYKVNNEPDARASYDRLLKFGSFEATPDYDAMIGTAKTLNKIVNKVPGLENYVEKVSVLGLYFAKYIKKDTLKPTYETVSIQKAKIIFPDKIPINLLADVCMNTFRAKKFYESLKENENRV